MKKLLNTNAKLSKPVRGYAITGLSLAPHSLSGLVNVCIAATVACRAACVLWFAGRSNFDSVRAAMIRRTKFFVENREEFEATLCKNIRAFARSCVRNNVKPAVRCNVASDVDWSHIARQFPNVTFYDYTKVRSRLFRADWPKNYQLIYSWNENTTPKFAREVLERGHNVAMVFDVLYNPQARKFGALPAYVVLDGKRVKVVDGDRHDLRLRRCDGRGVVVGLRLKGKNATKQIARDMKFAVKPAQQVWSRKLTRTNEVLEVVK